jgi:hypothetical protein
MAVPGNECRCLSCTWVARGRLLVLFTGGAAFARGAGRRSGIGGVIIGLMIAGIGIVPVAMRAVLLHGEWQALIVFVALIVLTFGLRALGFWLAKKVDQRAARLAFQRETQAA